MQETSGTASLYTPPNQSFGRSISTVSNLLCHFHHLAPHPNPSNSPGIHQILRYCKSNPRNAFIRSLPTLDSANRVLAGSHQDAMWGSRLRNRERRSVQLVYVVQVKILPNSRNVLIQLLATFSSESHFPAYHRERVDPRDQALGFTRVWCTERSGMTSLRAGIELWCEGGKGTLSTENQVSKSYWMG